MKSIRKDTIYTCAFFFLYIFFLFLGCSLFSPLYSFNYWADVNIYFTIGKGIWSGEVIYKDLFDHKGPIIFFIYSVGYLLSHTSFTGMFFLQILFHTLALYFSYLSIKLFVKKRLSVYLALLTPLFLLSFTQDGGSAEEFVYAFYMISLYYLLKFLQKNEIGHPPLYMFIHGVCLSVVLFTKLNLIVFWFFPLLILFLVMLFNRKFSNFFQNLAALTGGILFVTLPLLAYFYFNNAVVDFWNGYFEFNFLYGALGISNMKDFLLGIVVMVYKTTTTYYLVFSLLITGILYAVFGGIINSLSGRLIVLLSSLSLLAVILITRVLLPYYLIPFTVFSVLTCIMSGKIMERFFSKVNNLSLQKLYVGVFFILCLMVGYYQKNFFGYTTTQIVKRDFPATEVEILSEIISKQEAPTLLIAGFKKGLPVFTKLDILPNTKYFFFPNIHHEVYPTLRDEQTRYIRNKEIDFVITYESFRYYDYYKDILKDNYRIESIYKGKEGYNVYLYKKK